MLNELIIHCVGAFGHDLETHVFIRYICFVVFYIHHNRPMEYVFARIRMLFALTVCRALRRI